MAVDWSVYNDTDYKRINEEFLPSYGEGETKPEQIITAVNKLIYKWYNDGDVFDNTHGLEGWANDLSSYANWLYKNVPETKGILSGIESCYTEGDYEDLLFELADTVFDLGFLNKHDGPKVGSIYDCNGPFRFKEYGEEEDEDDYWEDDEEEYEEEYEEEDEEEY